MSDGDRMIVSTRAELPRAAAYRRRSPTKRPGRRLRPADEAAAHPIGAKKCAQAASHEGEAELGRLHVDEREAAQSTEATARGGEPGAAEVAYRAT